MMMIVNKFDDRWPRTRNRPIDNLRRNTLHVRQDREYTEASCIKASLGRIPV